MNSKFFLSRLQSIKYNITKHIYQPICGKIVDGYDILCYEKAMKQHNKDDSISFTLDEVENELGIN